MGGATAVAVATRSRLTGKDHKIAGLTSQIYVAAEPLFVIEPRLISNRSRDRQYNLHMCFNPTTIRRAIRRPM